MEISCSQSETLTCPQCDTIFEAEVWLIVAITERPDLLEYIRNGTLRDLTCPECHQTIGQVDAPLLVYCPGETLPLLFSPAQQTTTEQDNKQVAELIDILRKHLGEDWKDVWVEQGLAVIPHSLLPAALSDGPEAAIRQATEQALQEQKVLHQQDPETDQNIVQQSDELKQQIVALLETIEELIEAPTWTASYRCVITHPELLSDEIDEFLENLIAELQAREDKDNAQTYEEHRLLLRRCREIGTEQAFAEKMEVAPAALGTISGQVYLHRYDIAGNMDDLDHAIDLLSNGVKHTPIDLPVLPDFHHLLSTALQSRYKQKGQLEDLEQAITNYQKAVDRISSNSPNWPLYMINLGKGLFARYEHLRRLEDLEEAIKVCQVAVESALPNSLDVSDYLNTLASCLFTRYEHLGRLEDLDQVIIIYQRAVEHTSNDSPDLPICFTNLGTSLEARYKLLGHVEDLNQAFIATQNALQGNLNLLPSSLSSILTRLGDDLRDLYEHSGQLEDLERAIDAFQKAIKYTPDASSWLPAILNDLSVCLFFRYELLGQLEDLEQSIITAQSALQCSSIDSSELLSSLLTSLGTSLCSRYEHLGRLEDLERAIDTHLAAVKCTTNDLSRLPVILTSLGHDLRNLYERSGQLEDLERAIEAFQEAVQLAPTDATILPNLLSNLGTGLHIYYRHTGKLEGLEGAIEALQEALWHLPKNSLKLPITLDSLGVCLYALYKRTGRLEDLNRAITIHQEAVKQPSVRSLAMVGRFFSNLGNILLERYRHQGQQEDLEQAIAVYQEAVNRTPDSSPELPNYLNTLGLGLRNRYESLGQLEDLEQAITATQRAVELLPPGSPYLSSGFSNLGTSIYARYKRSGQLEDLEQAVTAHQKALETASSSSPDLLVFLNNLGSSLRVRYGHTGNPEDLHRAITCYKEACQKGGQVDIRVALTSALNWGNWAIERKNWTETIEAYTYGMQFIEQLYRTQILRASQETWLSEARDLYIQAAYAMARIGQLQEAALTLERSRARGLSEALARDCANLERVRQEDQEVYHRYQQVTEQLRQLEQVERVGNSLIMERGTYLTSPSFFDQIKKTREELEQVINRIRQIRGQEDFLAEPTYQDVVLAIQLNVPLIYLVTTSAGSFALLVHTAHLPPEVIWADDFTRDRLNTLLVGGDSKADKTEVGGYLFGQLFNPKWLSETLIKIFSQLRSELVGPLANRLRELRATGAVLIPTGLLGLLPLHAAYHQLDDKDIYLLDEFDVAYAPSARVLTAIRREAQARQVQDASLSLVGVGNPLPDPEVGAWAQGELRQVVSILQQVVHENLPQLQMDTATSSSEEGNSTQNLIHLWVHTLERLQMLCQRPSEELIYAGHDLLHAAILIGQHSDLPGDIAATLAHLAARIPPNLAYARAELESVMTLFPTEAVAIYYDHQATRDALWKALPKASIVHCSCHGSFDYETPLDSALLLAQGTRLTLRDLLNAEPQHLARLRLAVLSACQSAIIDFQRVPDESVGLLSGFLQAGVPSTVGTLWSVNEVSTALLVIHFYELYLLGDEQNGLPRQQPARSLRFAQRWLRDLTYNGLLAYLQNKRRTHHLSPGLLKEMLPSIRQKVHKGQGEERPYADAYHWAAFVYYGVL